MRITVKLFATFRKGRFDMEVRIVPPGSTVTKVIEDARLPESEIGILLVNGRHSDRTRELADGDTVAIFPLVGGG
jgi:molybdopterin converting factor small subunit